MVVRYAGPEVDGLNTHLAFTVVPTEVDALYRVMVTFVDPASNTRAMLNSLREVNHENFSEAQDWIDKGMPFKTLEAALVAAGYEDLAVEMLQHPLKMREFDPE
jgi:hypothetical protein